MLKLGLTGSIGTGKSTTAAMFRACGIPVHDADATVHRLYSGPAVGPIEEAFPGVAPGGAIDRKALAAAVAGDAEKLRRLEAIVHPLVRAEEQNAILTAAVRGHRMIVLDIPLLFETGAEHRCDLVLTTFVADAEQRRRVMARPGMTEALFHAILARQIPQTEKCRRAHARIDTGHGLEAAQSEVRNLLRALAGMVR
jgi:dephospho-CoA kinase